MHIHYSLIYFYCSKLLYVLKAERRVRAFRLDLNIGNGLSLHLRNTIDGLELLKELSLGGMSTLFPAAEILKGHGDHELEVEARSANQTVDLDSIGDALDGGKVLVDDLGDLLEGLRGGLVAGVLASPLTADTVELHGA